MPWNPASSVWALAAAVAAVGVILIILIRRSRRGTAASTLEVQRVPALVLRHSLAQSRQALLTRLQLTWGSNKDSDARFAELEEVLLTADVGLKATQSLITKLRSRARELTDADALRRALREDMRAVLVDGDVVYPTARPHIIVVAGVNGVGKTTTIGKLAHRYRRQEKKVLLVAADTFRAAASEQLEHWAQRVGATCVRHQSGADPSAVVFDGLKAACARGVDVVIVDTAGRLHVKTNLIEELKKVVRVIGKQVEGAPHEVLLVVDGTTGQNAISQARVFCEALPVSGLVLTKLDGTAKGGAVFAVRTELGVPIRYVGLGEAPEDLCDFDVEAFLDALLATNQERSDVALDSAQ